MARCHSVNVSSSFLWKLQYRLARQHGSILILGLIFLVILTIIGGIAIRVSTQQEHMAGNFRDRNIAFESAESALREAERKINDEALVLQFTDNLTSTSSGTGLVSQLCESGDPRRWNNSSSADCKLCSAGNTVTTSLDSGGYTCPNSGACWICGSYNWQVHSMTHGTNATYGSKLQYVNGLYIPQAAQYVIEEVKARVTCSDDVSLDPRRGATCVIPVRRITSRATGIAGSNNSAIVILQETYFPTN